MAEEKESPKSGAWFPSLNNLVFLLMAGLLVASQIPYHPSRPSAQDSTRIATHPVDARLWQDPFEAIKTHIDKQGTADREKELHRLENLVREISERAMKKREFKAPYGSQDPVQEVSETPMDNAAGTNQRLNVIAVMLPGTPYFEDAETRRRLRYAVLSGFQAALRYLPEDPHHINYFRYTFNGQDADDPNEQNAVESTIAYEWMEKSMEEENPQSQAPANPPAGNDAQQVPSMSTTLVLWLDNDKFRNKPYTSLKKFLEEFSSKLNEQVKAQAKPQDAGNDNTAVKLDVSVLGPFYSSTLRDMVEEVSKLVDQNKNKSAKDEANSTSQPKGLKWRFLSPSATVQDDAILPRAIPEKAGRDAGSGQNLQAFFKARGIDYLRVNTWDKQLAAAIATELKRRGIAPGKDSRIALIGEWDTIYGWLMPKTFAEALMKESKKKECRDGHGKHDSQDRSQDDTQDARRIYEEKDQCVFSFSYLRGLDGKKTGTGEKSAKPSRSESAEKGDDTLIKAKLEDADGDSQFDYLRRLAERMAALDQKIRMDTGNRALHPIKAIGVLGSDVYDKLLILEALREKFPDAVFFTTDMDARFLHPDQNKWARNLIIASGFGLELNRYWQRDIPPFRSNYQAAFFLATELALSVTNPAHSTLIPGFKKNNDGFIAQETVDSWLINPRIFEVARTRAFELTGFPERLAPDSPNSVRPEPLPTPRSGEIVAVAGLLTLGALLAFGAPRKFLESRTGFRFVVLLTVAVCVATAYAARFSGEVSGTPDPTGFMVVVGLGVAYIMALTAILVADDHEAARELLLNQPRSRKWQRLALNLAIIAFALSWLWFFGSHDNLLEKGEPYALMDGVSMWPSEGIRLIALILAGYFIIDMCRFPAIFTKWMERHLGLDDFFLTPRTEEYALLNAWLGWLNIRRRLPVAIVFAALLYLLGYWLLKFFGHPRVPYRGESMFWLDSILLRGFLVPSFLFLLCLVVDAAQAAVRLIEQSLSGEPNERVKWPESTLAMYANRFHVDRDELHEWVSMRFVSELTKCVYGFIGYPLIVVLLMIVARSSFFDNWLTPLGLKLIIGFSLSILFYWDFRLKKAADNARSIALKTLRQRTVRCYSRTDGPTSENDGKQFERLVELIERSDEVVYKSFFQRPIFQNSLLIAAALLTDPLDYSSLASKFF